MQVQMQVRVVAEITLGVYIYVGDAPDIRLRT